jgi:hypothetical protein
MIVLQIVFKKSNDVADRVVQATVDDNFLHLLISHVSQAFTSSWVCVCSFCHYMVLL